MDVDLANCPFCSGPAKLLETTGAVTIRCTVCDSQGPHVWKEGRHFAECAHDAIDRWNRRGGFGHARISLVDERIPPDTYKYIDRLRDVLERLERGNLGTPSMGFVCHMDGRVATISQLRCSDLELNSMVSAIVSALRAKYLVTEKP